MSDPYTVLGEQLLAAARRQEARHRTPGARAGRHRRLQIAIVVLVLLLAGATIALAASGLLSGSPVKPSGQLNPRVGEGIPAPGGSRLLSLRASDPEGGAPWGMRIVHTTRGQVCVQIGRVQNDQLGEIGTDGAFKNDGRFHPLPPDVLPTEGTASSNTLCVLAGQTFTGVLIGLDDSAARTPRGLTVAFGKKRDVSFGVLGSHALSVTYRTARGPSTRSLISGVGAYLIVRRATRPLRGEVTASSAYGSFARRHPSPTGAVSAITYRFGDLVCAEGTGATVTKRCAPPTPAPASSIRPTRSLHKPLRVTLDIRRGLIESAELEFTAPYAVTSGHQLYEIIQSTPAGCGPSGGAGLPLERDFRRGQRIRLKIVSPFPLVSRCGPTQPIQVQFINAEGPSATSPHESVVVGSTTITEPGTRPAPISTR